MGAGQGEKSGFLGNGYKPYWSCFGLWSAGIFCVVGEDRLKIQN